MKNILLLLISTFMLFQFDLNAQELQELHCKMTVDEILMEQAWDIDHPKSEFARELVEGLLNELHAFRSELEQSGDIRIEYDFTRIDGILTDAEEWGMNMDMFREDLEFIDSYR